ncbi:MAG: gliding motility-associated C-terminal domain-containing protein, partial [Sphingobacteriales bacterium]
AIYSGDCNNLVLIECDDDDSPNGFMPAINRTGLTPGSTIWIRFWKWNGGAGGTFGICVTIPAPPPPPPVNDDACAPILLTASATCNYATYTTASATASPGVPAPGCAQYNGGDVWFTVVVPASGALTIDTRQGGITDGGMALYSGNCNALTLIECDDDDSPNGAMPMIIRSGLTPGSTVFIRFWKYNGGAGGTFDICVTFPPPPPANDNCAGAVELTVNPSLVCTASATGTTASATPSTAPAPTCGAAGVNDDVWYSFVATNAIHTVTLTNVTGTVTDMAMALYSGTCGALVHQACSDPNTMTVNSLVIGQRYYVRVWTFTATASSSASFTICVGTPPPPPANDEPCNAITLPVLEDGSCNLQTYTNQSATGSNGVPAPGCASYNGGDVWFKLTVPCTGSIILKSAAGTVTDGGMAIYSGTCNGLTLLQCNDDFNGLMPGITRSGLVPGSTLWVRFWEFGGDNNGTFQLCAQVPPPPPPAGSCQTAQSFCTSTTPSTVPNITGQPSTGGGGIYGCLLTIPNPTYYYLQIQNSGNIDVLITQTSTTGQPLDVDFVVWGPFSSLNATCNGISAANIVDCSYSIAAVETANIPNAVAGQFYLFLVTNYSDDPGTITYQQIGGTGSSNCSLVCSLSATNSGPVCAGGSLNLTSSTVANATYLWSGPNCFSSTQQNPSGVTAPNSPGQYVYTVIATGPNGITCTDTTIVTVSPRPVIGADTTIKICSGSTVNLPSLYSTPGLTSSWTLNGSAVPNPAGANITGIYRLIAANSTGCTDTAFVNLTVDTVRSTATVAQIICTQTGSITINNATGIAPFQYSISTAPGVFQSSNQFIITAPGSYTVTTRDSLGCTRAETVVATFTQPFTVSAGPDASIFSGDEVQLFGVASEPVASVLWSPATGLSSTTTLNTVAKPTATTVYTLTATSLQGCTASDNVQVTIIPYCVKVKNAFTPNGDGNNDLWQVYDDYGCLKNISLHVFNRYGKKVFESRDYRNNWNGTFEGKPVPDGTYYAVLNFTLITGRVVTVKSDVTVLR